MTPAVDVQIAVELAIFFWVLLGAFGSFMTEHPGDLRRHWSAILTRSLVEVVLGPVTLIRAVL